MSQIFFVSHYLKPSLLQVSAWSVEKEELQRQNCRAFHRSQPEWWCMHPWILLYSRRSHALRWARQLAQRKIPFLLQGQFNFLFWSVERALSRSLARRTSLRHFEFLMFLFASSICSRVTEPFRFWAANKSTRGVVRVTEAWKDNWELGEGLRMPRPLSLDGRVLTILEQGGQPVSAGMSKWWIIL